MELRLLASSPTGPIGLDEAKAHLRVDGTADDFLIETLLGAAVQHVETVTHRAIMPQTWQVTWPAGWFTGRYYLSSVGLPHPPLRSVVKVETVDAAGVVVEIPASAYTISAPSGPTATAAVLWPGESWAWGGSNVRITYDAGYAGLNDVPRALKAAILLVLGDLYENREGGSQGRAYVVNPTVDRLLKPFVVSWP